MAIQPELSNASSSRGAPMGRSDEHDEESKTLPVVFTVALLKMVDGDYDEGGAYWGASNPPMYRATAEGVDNAIDLYFRAASIDQAKETVRKDYPLAIFDADTLDDFTEAYVTAALWSSNDGDEPLDDKYSSADIAPKTMKKMIADCAKFQSEMGGLLRYDSILLNSRYSVAEQAGHDFWLTRNHHGTGFWDSRWMKDAGEQLTAAAHKFGEVGLYVGDDGKIHA